MGRFFLLLTSLLVLINSLIAQTDSLTENFNDCKPSMFYSESANIKARVINGELQISAQSKTAWEDLKIYTQPFDMSKHTFLSFKVKSNENVIISIGLLEQNGNETKVSDAIPISKSIKGDGKWNYMYLDYSGHFDQSWPTPTQLNSNKLTGFSVVLNPGASFSGKVTIDSIAVGKAAIYPKKKKDIYINLNQLGYVPESEKIAIVNGTSAKEFKIVRVADNKVVLKDTLSQPQYWIYSEETVKRAQFSQLKDTGMYKLYVEGIGYSYPFKICENIYDTLAEKVVKAFYFQRCSYNLAPQYAGKWARMIGQPDTAVIVHASAASDKRPEGTLINSPGGWYDAGDYNKYIVNSGITVYTLLSILEDFPTYSSTLKITIPEINNKIPDLLDEILFNLRWMQTMQDKNDGGVYHKLTHAGFESMELPEKIHLPRYVVQKTTAASLDFCAVMAQAARILKNYERDLPGLADSCMLASMKAWMWAKRNPAVYYNQFENNRKYKPEIYTGMYGDGHLSDEFMWAASELFICTGNELMIPDILHYKGKFSVPDWPNVQTLGLMSLVKYRKFIAGKLDTAYYMSKLLDIANSLESYKSSSAFRISMGQDSHDFAWGSNAVAANQSFVLIEAYKATGDKKYFTASFANLDYLLGRNALNYCFITGNGSRSPMFIHHRLSEGDKNIEPIPGLLVGGPQPGREDGCPYNWDAPAKTYIDAVCSFSTNEIAINWNAPLSHIVWGINAIYKNLAMEPVENPQTKLLLPDLTGLPITDTAVVSEYIPIIAFPNVKANTMRCALALIEPSLLEIRDKSGRVVAAEQINQTGTLFRSYPVNFETGTYNIYLKSKNGVKSKTIIINK